MTKTARNPSDKVMFAMALSGIVTAPLYLLARYNALACTFVGWSGTLAEACCLIRSPDKHYVIHFASESLAAFFGHGQYMTFIEVLLLRPGTG